MRITPHIIGTFVDSIAGTKRTASDVAGRLLEECVELGLATGLTSGQILEHVADALHNQALKASATSDHTIFPSQLTANASEVAEECADVGIILKDLCYVAKIDLDREEIIKHAKFVQKKFRVSVQGTIYSIKDHVV